MLKCQACGASLVPARQALHSICNYCGTHQLVERVLDSSGKSGVHVADKTAAEMAIKRLSHEIEQLIADQKKITFWRDQRYSNIPKLVSGISTAILIFFLFSIVFPATLISLGMRIDPLNSSIPSHGEISHSVVAFLLVGAAMISLIVSFVLPVLYLIRRRARNTGKLEQIKKQIETTFQSQNENIEKLLDGKKKLLQRNRDIADAY